LNENEKIRRVRVLISGQIQDDTRNDNFDANTWKKATELKLSGWVQELNGTNKPVEAVFEGPIRSVDKMLNCCKEGHRWNDGLCQAKVTGVENLHDHPLKGGHSGFTVRSRIAIPAENEKIRRVRVLISGKVQGVFYRDTICEKAKEIKLSGWVQNLDGTNKPVEAVFQGSDKDVNEMLQYCWEGSSRSSVTGVEELQHDPPEGDDEGFKLIGNWNEIKGD